MLAHALDLLFPPQCLNCQSLVPAHGTLCLTCWQDVKFITEPYCHCCGLPFEYGIGEKVLCGDCLKSSPPYAKARAVFVYDEKSRVLVLKFKYQDQTQLAPVYGVWLAKTGKELIEESDVIVPVPLHYWRLLGRRYNQSALLAQSLAKHTGMPVALEGLKRTRATDHQTGLTRAQREKNVRGAFETHEKYNAMIRGKAVLLIDDVMTTGTTLDQCAKALLAGGASRVNVLTLARTAD